MNKTWQNTCYIIFVHRSRFDRLSLRVRSADAWRGTRKTDHSNNSWGTKIMPRSVADCVLKQMIRQKSLGRQVTIFCEWGRKEKKLICPCWASRLTRYRPSPTCWSVEMKQLAKNPALLAHHRTIGGRIILITVTDETSNKIWDAEQCCRLKFNSQIHTVFWLKGRSDILPTSGFFSFFLDGIHIYTTTKAIGAFVFRLNYKRNCRRFFSSDGIWKSVSSSPGVESQHNHHPKSQIATA